MNAREPLETMPGAWYMALYVLDTVAAIVIRRDKSKPRTQSAFGGGLGELCSLWAWDGVEGPCLGHE